jgi:hypothetical protein
VNAEHDKAPAELAQQKAIAESPKAEAKRAKEVAESVAGSARAELAEPAQKQTAKQAEFDAQMTLHNNIIASMGSIRAKLETMVPAKN